MLDSEDSTVTYTAVSSPFGGLSDIGSPRVDGPPMMPEDPYAYVVAAFQASPSPDYVSGPNHPPLLEFVPEHVYPEFMPSKDEVFLVEEQPLPAVVSPTAESPGYIVDFDPEEDPTDYLADRDEEEEMSIREQPPTPVWSEAEIDRLIAIPSPPPSPLSLWLSPLPQIPSPPLPVSSPLPVSPPLPVSSPPLPASPTYTYPLGYKAAMIQYWDVADTVMSDSEDSTVTYTEVSSLFEGLSNIGSLGFDGLHMMSEDPYAYVMADFQDPPSPNYVPGLEEPEQTPPLPDFVPELVYQKFMPPGDEVFPAEKQPLPAAVSHTIDSLGYIVDSNPEGDPEEDPTDYPADEGDDDDDDRSSNNDKDDDDADVKEEEDGDEEEEEEHPAPADSIPPPPVHYTTARISIPVQAPTPFCTPPLLPIPLPTSSPPLILPSTSHRAVVLKVTLPPRKRWYISLGLRYELSESSFAPTARPTRGFRAYYGFVAILENKIRRDPERDVGYKIIDTWDEMLVGIPGDDKVLMSGQLNMLRRDRRAHARIAKLIETEARLSRQAWVQSMDASDIARAEVMSLRTIVLAQQEEIVGFRAVDHT
nr:hypothetical protein [Tanacetum cinerariifolium]